MGAFCYHRLGRIHRNIYKGCASDASLDGHSDLLLPMLNNVDETFVVI